jgi:4-hydroxyphenylpyruvate dioxygenase
MGDAGIPPSRAVIRSINPNYIGFDYIGWYVGNARQTVSYFVNHYGFSVLAYRGPETGSFATTAYVIGNGAARFTFTAPLSSPNSSWDTRASEDERTFCADLHAHLTKHGDGVKDIAFQVDDVHSVWAHAVENGAQSVRSPEVLKSDDGEVVVAAISTYGDTIHTLINRSAYKGPFLPGFKAVDRPDYLQQHLPKVDLIEIDHCVGNQPWDGLESIVSYYENALNFHRYWTVDDKDMCSDFSAMRSVVVASPNEVIKMPMNEPATGKKKSQIEEYVFPGLPPRPCSYPLFTSLSSGM